MQKIFKKLFFWKISWISNLKNKPIFYHSICSVALVSKQKVGMKIRIKCTSDLLNLLCFYLYFHYVIEKSNEKAEHDIRY